MAATPAQVTARASRFALPFGRSLPSEGLSIDQMCQAIHAFGVSPNLVRLLPNRFARARSIIHASAISELSPILIIQSAKTNDRQAVVSQRWNEIVQWQAFATLRRGSLRSCDAASEGWEPAVGFEPTTC